MKTKRLRFLGIVFVLSILVVYGVRFISASNQTKRDMDKVEVFKVKNVSMVNDSKNGNSLLQGIDLSNHNQLLEISIRKPKNLKKDIKFVYLYKNEMATVDHQQLKDLRFQEHYNLISSFGLLLKTIILVVVFDIILISLWAFVILRRQNLRYKKNKHIAI